MSRPYPSEEPEYSPATPGIAATDSASARLPASEPGFSQTDPFPLNLDAVRACTGFGPQAGRSIVLIGLMGAGKSTIGRRLAQRLGLGFVDADAEIERAAGCSISDVFRMYGENAFRDGERRVIRRLLDGPSRVLATGGGAFMNAETRGLIRERAISVWLRCPLDILVRRVSGRGHRPLLNNTRPRDVLERLMVDRHPVYAEADIIVQCGDDNVDNSTTRVIEALALNHRPRRLPIALDRTSYDVVIGAGLLERAGALLAPVVPQKRAVVVTDSTVAGLYLERLQESLNDSGFLVHSVVVPPGEKSKSLEEFNRVTDAILEQGVERRTTIIALGGGIVGDLAGFVAATVLRGLPFVQIPTTLLSQVDSSVGGKTGINTRWGKNLIGAFHQPVMVLADISTLATLPVREIRAGYAEIVKAGLLGDEALFAWCEMHGAAVLSQEPEALAEAVEQACAFKAAVVTKDEFEQSSEGGRALLNLGHTFGHALEAEMGYDGRLLHGEGVSIGLRLAFLLSVRLGYCPQADLDRVTAHLEACGMPARISDIGETFSADVLLRHMTRDKKMRDGKLTFVLVRGIGQAFTCRNVPEEAVRAVLMEDGCASDAVLPPNN
ncbi:3-dehydroquinate synthase [Acetobacter fallax]|uniref:Multifunctional fusion protein n=1 Tax=Acetobacter fallax TaxID=1737473 RepID=A0ABX0KBB2_9PROT|nr:3-dehydroquinate synthase [Acetobacter fallax]NHO31247.1 3-dehydroquinate synthase [Acetobacter fallax]NHO34804.1 3-dehydroquinate synthase [Acetobacter fallax]